MGSVPARKKLSELKSTKLDDRELKKAVRGLISQFSRENESPMFINRVMPEKYVEKEKYGVYSPHRAHYSRRSVSQLLQFKQELNSKQ